MTVIAPVGPLTWNLEPPKRAAKKPAIIAVVNPAAADIPEVIPKPIARGKATIATVIPAIRSAVKSFRVLENSLSRGQNEKNIVDCKRLMSQCQLPLSLYDN
jgi:hypothetical protein